MNNPNPSPAHLDRLDVLMSRAVDGESTAGEWSEFAELAGTDPRPWRELAERQRDHAALARAVDIALATARRVELPADHAIKRSAAMQTPAIEVVRHRSRLIGTWGGWAAAAAIVAAVALAPKLNLRTAPTPPQNTAGLGGVGTLVDPAAALRMYLDKGQQAGTVVGEVPTRVLVDSKPLEGGGYEITYLRQIIERAKVPHLYQVGTDDLGRQVPVRATVDQLQQTARRVD